ncbi:DNA topoisomerase [uncultured Sneathiella sp.]|jgi:DNA topoisomerase-3|uniref:DNA topoisomerase n=1 Tax=uncultured Sneathiella sp. TaxID=879315 RepID=UPI0030EF20BC|tara:strand:+ start:76336 stop:78813 length:2478 start_codon:yes stop_codon:yes gene_type:complete
MIKRLYLTEKHDQAAVLAQALGGYSSAQKKSGYYDCTDGHRVVWAYGHLFRLKEPQEHNPDWAEWRMDDLPLAFDRFDYVVDDNGDLGQLKNRQFQVIKESLPHYDEFVVATDDDREGEVIGWLPITLLGYQGPVKRIVYTQIDVKALKIANQKMVDGASFKGRFYAGMARAVIDFVIGMNATRASTLAFGQSRRDLPSSAGRVQTPILNLVGDRCDQISRFTPEPFYELMISGTVKGAPISLTYAPEDKIFDKSEATLLLQSISASLPLSVTSVEKRRAPPRLFNLNSIQGAASTAFDFAPALTLSVLQELYLRGILTYPRPDPRVLPEAMSSDTGALLYHLARMPELETGGLAQLIDKHQFQYRREVYSDREMAGSSHHAIIPNPNRMEATTLDLSSLTENQQKIFLLVAKVFIAAHLPDYVYELTTVSAIHEGRAFKATVQKPVSDGWRSIYQEPKGDDDDGEPEVEGAQLLHDIADGDLLTDISSRTLDKMTRPPAYFSVASMLAKMAELGLGAPSTFANYETILRARDYIGGNAKRVLVTPRGEESLKFWRHFTPQLTSPDLTVQIEKMLEEVAGGEKTYHDVITYVQGMARELVSSVKSAPAGFVDLSLIQVSRPPSLKLKKYVKRAADRLGEKVSAKTLASSHLCSEWIDQREDQLKEEFSKPTDQQLKGLDAILSGNEDLSFAQEDRTDRDKVSAFLDAHLKDARYPPSEKMLAFAQSRAEAIGVLLPMNAQKFADRLREWLVEHPVPPSPKQLQFAQTIATALSIDLPEKIRASSDICSEFIDGHLAQYQAQSGKGGGKGGSKGGKSKRYAKRKRR